MKPQQVRERIVSVWVVFLYLLFSVAQFGNSGLITGFQPGACRRKRSLGGLLNDLQAERNKNCKLHHFSYIISENGDYSRPK